ncbi:antirepressor [Oceanobacillus picturae]|uniref:Antirepressor n=1 Tax=Oceanobacillus picturae TaxID=171693 RepID=A0A0U9H9L0_9BACI|nr:phage antirepressor KilAC domain-containing protein [Oceanobacillus picturae]GAQ17985.1 antirepressor [Oceanobacillus picturae]
MNQLKVFENDLFKVSAKLENDQALFDVEEVARSLGFTTVAKSGNVTVRWSRVNSYLPNNSQHLAKGDLIPESLVYKLAFKASNDLAEKFQDWLAIEVIPSIRKHGGYMTPEKVEEALLNPDTLIKLATDLKEEREMRFRLEKQKQQDEPYTTFGKVVSGSDASISIGAFAKLMYDEHGMKIGRNKMFRWLRDKGYLIKSGRERNNPKQQYIEQGLFETSVSIVSRTAGDVESLTTLVTGKGQVYLSKKLLQEYEVFI